MASSAAICQSTTSAAAAAAAATVNDCPTLCFAIGAVVVGHEGMAAEDGNADKFGSSTENIENEKEKNGSNIISGSLAAGNVLESHDSVSRTYTHNMCDAIFPLKNDDTVIATNAKAWNPLEEVDSALLSALCDPRERKALFRLEQVMIDFMRDKSSWSMEVGGALNAIVLHQNSGGGNSENNPGDFEVAEGQMHVLSQQGMQELHHQQQRGLKQTSFQRLILHRLADRFNVIREQIIQPYFPPLGNERGLVDVGVPPHYSPGLIRLVKTNESSIPSNLLIEIDQSLLINYKNPRARNYFGGGNEDSTKYITDNMASATLEAQPPVIVSKKSKKMVIMKRSDSTNGSGETLGISRDSRKDDTRKKKLEDREKAYEEARARIFGMGESLGNEYNGVDTDTEGIEAGQSVVLQSQDSQEYASTPLYSSSCHSSFSVENDAKIPHACFTAADTCVVQPFIPPTDSSAPLPEPQSYQESANITSGSATPEAGTFRRPSFSSSTVPAVVTKAVYRNRQQEENDPDFKRRSGVRPVYIPYVTSPYSLPLGANPYVGMGQQPSPSQMAAMHNMQLQAKHSPHFYPGQAQQYQVPQDVAYANAVNNPPHQWAAPQHGYYPSLPRQQQQIQEKLLQPWEIRSNSSQMPPYSVAPSNSGMKTSLPQSKQPAKVLWGPGAARGDTSLLDESLTNSTVERGATIGDTVAYTPEDFPALG